GFPESHDTDRLVTGLVAAGVPETEIEPRYRQAYAFAGGFSKGVLMPMGFEYGWARRLGPVVVRDGGPEPIPFDISEFIAAVNAMKMAVPALNGEGPQRLLTNKDDPLVVLERQTESRDECALILVNTDRKPREVLLETLVGADFALTDFSPGRDAADRTSAI